MKVWNLQKPQLPVFLILLQQKNILKQHTNTRNIDCGLSNYKKDSPTSITQVGTQEKDL